MSTKSTMNAMKQTLCNLTAISLLLLAAALQAQPVMEDEGVVIDRAELEEIVSRWDAGMRKAAANDVGDRLELLNAAMVRKKMARQAESFSLEEDPAAYWIYFFQLQSMQRRAVFDHYMATLEIPDMSALAQERYITEKDKFALVPETRESSHILLKCPPGCDREPLKPQAQEMLEKLRNGADFEEMVAAYSQDPGTKARKGSLNRAIEFGQAGITPHYSAGVFEIEEVGGYSDIVQTEFGLHLIRLDGIHESYYRPYEEVRAVIIESLEGEYTKLAGKEFQASFRVTDEVRIDGVAMEEILQQYKTAQ